MTSLEESTFQPNAFLTSLFRGRMTRRAFFDFYALYAVVAIGLAVAFSFASRDLQYHLLTALLFWCVALFVPFAAASSRRFHDTGRSGWWFSPQIAVLVLAPFIFAATEKTPYERLGDDAGDVTLSDVGIGCNVLILRFSNPLPELTERQKSPECVEWRQNERALREKRRDAYQSRRKLILFAGLGSFAVAHIATLYALARPSQPGPNKYGPNPHEVTP